MQESLEMTLLIILLNMFEAEMLSSKNIQIEQAIAEY